MQWDRSPLSLERKNKKSSLKWYDYYLKYSGPMHACMRYTASLILPLFLCSVSGKTKIYTMEPPHLLFTHFSFFFWGGGAGKTRNGPDFAPRTWRPSFFSPNPVNQLQNFYPPPPSSSFCRIHTHNGPTSNAAGPAATVSSVTVVLQPVSTTYVWPEMGAVPLGAVGTVRVKPPSTAVALWDGISANSVKRRVCVCV